MLTVIGVGRGRGWAAMAGHTTFHVIFMNTGFSTSPASTRAYRAAEGGERACNSRTSCIEGEMLVVTKFKSKSDTL